ncbi:hypothetical protein F4553_002194 [Allocatelliglobosispora scoriae]|uniref:Uncharacterized protein n=1 Tax=Allocatelliglobosispora scoriae TaxID=643052 RepID=A0A841BMC3_9ACTN|nr:hypothetical protein [Allocatelliglobosispora scoriae]MBB5868815.1 hypothetical protein [Allocatelliglobosispora scoriae]
MIAETRAASAVSPLPCETDRPRALGRIATKTGTPMWSSPVTSATRVIPIADRCGVIRRSVSAGETARSVPSR